jgi:hypothetical protein
VSDWFRVTSGQLWSFKLENAHNRLHARSDHHSPLKDVSHDRTIQDMKDFFDWRKSGYAPKKFQHIEDKNWSHRVIFSYWTHHQPCNISEEGSHTWRWSNYSIKDSWSAWFEWRRLIGDFQSTGNPIRNRSSPGLMTCSGANDDTSISSELVDHWISKIRQTYQPKRGWTQQVTYQESYRNFKITPSRISIRSLYLLELESGSSRFPDYK